MRTKQNDASRGNLRRNRSNLRPALWPAVLIFFLVLVAPAEARDFYVATTGNDASPGTRSKPFASFERVRDALRELPPAARKRAITVWIQGGDYVRTNTLELTRSDSGTPTAPITWRAQRGESVRLLGGRPLSGFEKVTDPKILARLSEPARSEVHQLDLQRLGMSDFGEMKSRGFGRPAVAAHCELFCDHRPMTLARWPNEGEFLKIAGFPEANAENDGHGGKIGRLEEGFAYAEDRPRKWQDTGDIWVHGYWSWDWANSYERIERLDLDRKLVQTAAPYGLYGFRKGQRFYFLNVLEELDQPGEWFLDRKSGLLYFWPPDRTPSAEVVSSKHPQTNSPEILLSLLAGPLLKLADVSHVTFRGLVFEATRGNAIEIQGGAQNRVAGCLIRNIGDNAITIQGGTNHGVLSCNVYDTGDGGVTLDGGDRKTLTPARHFVQNCEFARQGRWSKCYVPAVLMGGVGMSAGYNLIHDHPHCAILFTGNDHLIEFNEIHHIALETGDVGAIYTGRNYTFRGNRIRNNFIHHNGGVGLGSMGVYMDDCVSGCEISGNIFHKVQRAAFLGGGRDHRVINNIFVECNYAVELDGRGLDKSPVWHGMVNDTMRKRLAEAPALYRERYPEIKSLDAYYGPPGGTAIEGAAFTGVPPEGNVVARNVCAGKWLNVYWHATPGMLRLENNFTNATGWFVHPLTDQAGAEEFELKRNCPARKLGFKNLPLDRIGLYTDELRGALPGPDSRVARKRSLLPYIAHRSLPN
jgi:hypothetical protein